MKLKAAKKLKFGDRVFVKHSCENLNVAGKYAEVINHPIGTGKPVDDSYHWVDVSKTGGYKEDGDWGSVNIEYLKRVNVLPKDCIYKTKVRVTDAYASKTSLKELLGEVLLITSLSTNRDHCYAILEKELKAGDVEDYYFQLSDLELYYE